MKYDLVGIGLGPSNLSLAALSKPTDLNTLFIERKKNFRWHSEVMFDDSTMQTSFLKDLVTSVAPTSPYSFLNYLVQKGLFHSFMNTHRSNISRQEYEQYCQWVAMNLSSNIHFESEVESISPINQGFEIVTNKETVQTKNICIGTGPTPNILECAKPYLGRNVLHMKSEAMRTLDLADKRVMVIGGGQSGIEVFRNALKNVWGRARSLQLITERDNLQVLDESSFSDEYFTPSYIENFLKIPSENKSRLIESQRLTSDGNTPWYLETLYRDLYYLKNVEMDPRQIEILPMRNVHSMEQNDQSYMVTANNLFETVQEQFEVDVVIMCTGFTNRLPTCLDSLRSKLDLDNLGRFRMNSDYSVKLDHDADANIYAVNFSRHHHGISDPQTSLMAWRSGVILNAILGEELYPTTRQAPSFVRFSSNKEQDLEEGQHVSC